MRKDVFGSHTAGLPTSRKTNTYPVPAQAWRAIWPETEGESGQVMRQPAVSFQLAGRRWLLRLRGGPERRRQLQAFAKMASGEAPKAELLLNWQPSSAGCHRRVSMDREPGGGNSRASRYIVRLVAELPRQEGGWRRSATLEVRTARNALLVAKVGDDEPWVYRANNLRRRIRAYEGQRNCLADDMKTEGRSPDSDRQRLVGRGALLAERHRRFAEWELRRAASFLVQYAKRRRVRGVRFDDRERRYAETFPWFRLETMISEACDREGLSFEHVLVANDETANRSAG